MKIFNKTKFFVLLLVLIPLVIFTPIFLTATTPVYAATPRVDLLTADGFAVLGGSAISSIPTSVITGNVGLSPTGGTAITGLTCAEVTGTIYDTNRGYEGGGGGSTACLVTNDSHLTAAKNGLTTASNDAAGRTTTSTIATELGGSTLTDGVYDSTAGTFGITGTLTLDGGGNADSVFIFKAASTLTTATSSKVVLTNSAQACNVYWLVGSSATLGTSTTLVGNVMASESITDSGSSTVNGRLLASNAAVTLNKTTIAKQTCAAGTAGGPASTSTSTSTSSTNSSPAAPYCPPLNYIAPIIIESRRIDADSIFISWGPYSGINTFIVEYGLENGKWLYNTKVTGFSTTINALPLNQPIWVRITATDYCSVGTYGESKLVGGPRLPNTGFAPHENNISWYISAGILGGISVLLVLIQKKHKFSSKH